jgi:hypothetical protein
MSFALSAHRTWLPATAAAAAAAAAAATTTTAAIAAAAAAAVAAAAAAAAATRSTLTSLVDTNRTTVQIRAVHLRNRLIGCRVIIK